ncbi:phytanoyl-CoA dioxygenase family protein [bacterium]|jgi:hypothetical protein|nr:phytanoyl-CoA dioxygenase family protein [bacterium]
MNAPKLSTRQMAEFAARGFLRFDAVVPEHINKQFLEDIGAVSASNDNLAGHYRSIMDSGSVPTVDPGTPLDEAYPKTSAIANLIEVPQIKGAIQSLVGSNPAVDHHFLHVTFPPRFYTATSKQPQAQPTHQDSTIDPRQAFDVQLFYFPHDITPAMGGTRFIPGSQFRLVSEAALARYQNIRGQQHVVCRAGTVLLFHMGLWHGGGLNESDALRYLFKIRLCPRQKQENLWDRHRDPLSEQSRPIFWTKNAASPDHLATILTTPEPWFEADTQRLEFIRRIHFWRYISGDETFDADYWLTRIENEYS